MDIITNQMLPNDKIVGRLGNKMFVIAAILGAAPRLNKKPVFPHWQYEDKFDNNLEYVDIFPEMNSAYQEPHFHYSLIPNLHGNMNVFGYYQSYRYFDHIKDQIIDTFKPTKEIVDHITNKYEDLLNHFSSVSIHVRRGDYVGDEGHHPTISKSYIINSMKRFGNGSKFVFFSDDIEWCKTAFGNLKGWDVEFVSDDDYIDLFLMSMLHHNIIANSSFSWWAAYLNRNPEKVILYPSPWFGEKYNHDTKDLCPKEWEVVKCY